MTTSASLNFIHTVRDGILILELRGAIEAAQSLDLATETALQAEAKNVIVVLTEVDYINSTGFGALVRLSDTLSHQGKTIYVVGLQAKVHIVFNVLGAHHLFNVLSSLDEALKAALRAKS